MAFVQPEVEVGQVVHWFDSVTTKQPAAAIVTKVFDASVNLSVTIDGYQTIWCRSGVRHAEDPALKEKPFLLQNGCWRHTKSTQDLQALRDLLAGSKPDAV